MFPDDVVYSHFAKVITSFQPGLFAGAEMTSHPRDNLDLERWFRSPKSHERRVHGHRHAGVRIVRDGPTLAPTPTPATLAFSPVKTSFRSAWPALRPANSHRNSDTASC